jgi:UDP-GlcNAc3NAcA epimerase
VRLVSVVGNRPQFVKAAPLSLAVRARDIEEIVVHTGQHYDRELSAVFFEELELAEPAYALDLRTADVGSMERAIGDVLRAERPDEVLVFGDTNSTLAGARAAADAGVPLAHVEAGLRSRDLDMPEERARIEVDRRADVLFCPDERSSRVLTAEGVGGRVHVVGDVMYDAALTLAPIARHRSTILERLGLGPRGYVLATLHRQANVAPDRLARLLDGLRRIAEPVVLPAHPRTRAAIEAATLPLGSVRLLEPLGYLDLAALSAQARVIVTDSGGLQKEAYWHGIPCVTMRPSTEWIDTVEVGANALVDDDPAALASAVDHARPLPDDRPRLYGDGRAAERIAGLLASGVGGKAAPATARGDV